MQDVRGKTALITGGAGGMGLGIAKACLKAGMKVIITDLRQEALDAAVAELGGDKSAVVALQHDVTDRARWAAIAEEAGKVHLLALNAGVGVIGPMQKATYKDWDYGMSVNVGGVVNGLVSMLPGMLAHGEWGRIVVTSSTGGFSAVGGAGIYCAAKFAVAGMLESLATDLKDTPLGCSVFFPGPVQTPLAQTTDEVRPAHLKNEVPSYNEADRGARPRPGAFDASVFMTKEEVGERVLNGVRRGDLFIMTHPEFRDGLKARCDALLRAVPDEPLNEKRAALVKQFGTLMYNPVYDAQRDVPGHEWGGDEIERKS